MIAATAVHTTGINWESVTAIAAVTAIIVTVVLWVFARRDRRTAEANKQLRTDMTSALDNLAVILTAKLETKESVASINLRLARVEAVVDAMRSEQMRQAG